MLPRLELKTNAKIAVRRNYWSYVAVSFLLSLFVASGSIASGAYGSYEDADMTEYAAGEVEPYAGVISDNLSAILPVLIVALIVMVLFWLLVSTVLEVGGRRFFILNRMERAPIRTFFSIFGCGHYGNVVKTIALRDIFELLWGLLLVVPGIVKHYEYLMIPYIMAENPDMDRKEAFEISRRMMYGEKWQTFILGLSFIGWDILSVLTFGLVGIFWVYPYQDATYAELYAFNKARAYREGYIG